MPAEPERSSLRRRSLLVGGTAGMIAVAGCAGTPRPSGSGSTSSVPGSPSTSPSGTAAGAAPDRSAWRPDRGDVDPGVKRTAARLVEALGSWSRGEGSAAAARRRIGALGQPGSLAGQAGALLGTADEAVVRVIEAQTGGLLADSASILVVCRQRRRSGSGAGTWGGTTLDVRLVRRAGGWRVTELHPARPGPAQNVLSDLQHRVLSSARIVLPPVSEADIRSGNVHQSVLRAMLTLSTDYRVGVSVVRSGHPRYVFGTDRLSDHPQGRAFDTFRINGRLVVDPATPRGLVTGYMQAARRAGSYNVGGPYLLSGSGSQFFSDPTHHDHVHAGFAV